MNIKVKNKPEHNNDTYIQNISYYQQYILKNQDREMTKLSCFLIFVISIHHIFISAYVYYQFLPIFQFLELTVSITSVIFKKKSSLIHFSILSSLRILYIMLSILLASLELLRMSLKDCKIIIATKFQKSIQNNENFHILIYFRV